MFYRLACFILILNIAAHFLSLFQLFAPQLAVLKRAVSKSSNHNAPILTKVVCFSRLLKCLRSLYGKHFQMHFFLGTLRVKPLLCWILEKSIISVRLGEKTCPEDHRLASWGLVSDDKHCVSDPARWIGPSYPHTYNGVFFMLTVGFLVHLSRSDKVSFCDRSLSVVVVR